MSHTDRARRDYAARLMNTFGPPQLVLERGEGVHVFDVDGRRYLDLLAGIAVNALGHAHPDIVAAVSEQAGSLIHVSNFFATRPQLEAARHLLDVVTLDRAPEGSRVFFTNSGTEANEAALKLVRLHGGPSRPRILALTHAFHGRTTGALALTWKEAYRAPFAPLMPGVEFIDPTPQALRAAMGPDVAGLFVEPIQGEAGVHPLSREFFACAREVTAEMGALLVVDEVQTGVGRTGAWMGHHHFAGADGAPLVPDVVTVAKGLGSGVPIGACVGIGPVGQAFAPGQHGTTFGGNPLACAAAATTLDVIARDGLIEHAADVGAWFARALRETCGDSIGEVRQWGLLIGIDLPFEGARAVVAGLLERGIIANAATPHTLRLVPPLTITTADLEHVPLALVDAIEEVRA